MTGVVEIDIKVPSRRKADVITAYLDKEVKQVLEVWAQSEQRSLSSLVAYLLTKAASSYQTDSTNKLAIARARLVLKGKMNNRKINLKGSRSLSLAYLVINQL
jgi:Holliday junction resolvasome RuvABC endonuclease subunit